MCIHASRLAATAAGCTLALAVSVDGAAAAPKLKEARFAGNLATAAEVRVGAEDGRWVIMRSPGITYRFSYRVEANRILRCIYVSNNTVPITAQSPFSRCVSRQENVKRTAWGNASFFIGNAQIGGDSALVIQACNDLLEKGKTTAREHTTFTDLPLAAEVNVGRSFIGEPTATFRRLRGHTLVKVICEAEPQKIEAHAGPVVTDFTLKAVKSDTTCPKDYRLEAKFRKAALPGETRPKVKFRIVIDGESGQRIVKEMRKKQRHNFVAVHTETLKLDPGRHEVKIKVVGGPDSETKVRTVDCPPMAVNFVTLRYDSAPAAPCPKTVFETAKFHTTRPGWVDYEIRHQNGMVVWRDRAKAKRFGDQYMVVAQRVLRMGAVDADMMAQEKANPAANSGWVRMKVTCPGGGSEAPPQPLPEQSSAPEGPAPAQPRVTVVVPKLTLTPSARRRQVACPRGTRKAGRACVAIACPKGTERHKGGCRKIVRDCPGALKRVGSACVRIAKPQPACRGSSVRGRCVTGPKQPSVKTLRLKTKHLKLGTAPKRVKVRRPGPRRPL